ncbi:MAG: hypothetical protein NUW01_14075 [Gemmatimonadaceae bacterium]|nr:hypothetical protein [Gemmatimonadaceae bacterium]
MSIGKADDRSTWCAQFKPEATDADRKLAAELIRSWVEPPPPPPPPTVEQQLTALRKAVLAGDKADLEQIEAALKG